MPVRKEIENKVIEVVTEILDLNTPPNLEDSFREDLKADSIDIVTLFVSLEDELDMPFEESQLKGKDTLSAVVDVLENMFLQKQNV